MPVWFSGHLVKLDTFQNLVDFVAISCFKPVRKVRCQPRDGEEAPALNVCSEHCPWNRRASCTLIMP